MKEILFIFHFYRSNHSSRDCIRLILMLHYSNESILFE